MRYDIIRDFECPICGKKIEYDESFRTVYYLKDNPVAMMSTDCHGIPFRMVCMDCYDKIEDEDGYDGEYYTELDECIYDY